MEVCNKNHEKIVYDSHSCPVCTLISNHTGEVYDLKQDKINLERMIDKLEKEISDLEKDQKE